MRSAASHTYLAVFLAISPPSPPNPRLLQNVGAGIAAEDHVTVSLTYSPDALLKSIYHTFEDP
jgi:hypothetical protein